jgi:hypothetical protein
MRKLIAGLGAALLLAGGASVARASSVEVFGTEDCLTTGCYGASDPTAGATLTGLSAGTVTAASQAYGHSYPFSPTPGDYPGTDQIYVGSTQTADHDGYGGSAQRINGPDVITLDYASLIPTGQSVATLTLGIAADDFQFPVFGQPFIVTVNGTTDAALTSELESLNESGPVVQFFTIGLNPSLDNAGHTLTLSINEGGDGGDGYAVDFLTVGVTTVSSIPEPAIWAMMLTGFGGIGAAMRLARRASAKAVATA